MRSISLWIDQIKDRDGTPICIYDLVFSTDGNWLMVAADNKIYVYDINNGSLIQTLKGHKDTVICICFSYDGKRFASGSVDKQVIIWTAKMEAILKYGHNDTVRCLQYNPKSHQLLSCTASDFGLWTPEQKSVAKNKVPSQINCCAWNEDGNVFALGLNTGISIRTKSGEERYRIDRGGAVWGTSFIKTKENQELLAIADWTQTLAFLDIANGQSQGEKNLNYDPLFMALLSNGDFFLLGGSNKKVSLHTLEGTYLDTVVKQNSWIWTCKTHQSKLAVGCQDGSLAVHELSLMTVHSLYKERYAYRDSMTDVVIQHLLTAEKVRIKCRDLVKKIAVYEKTLAIQLPERVILYELNEESTNMSYKVKDKISVKIECSLLVLCAANLVLCQERRLQSLSFSGQLEKEWLFESPIRYIKTIGGVAKQEGLLVGLKNGQIQSIFLNNLFQSEIIKLTHSIRCIDLDTKHQKLAVIDERNKCFIFEMATKQLLFEEPNVTSIAWNAKYPDLLCIAGPGFISIKVDNLPVQIVNNEFSSKTFVIGFSRYSVFTLQQNAIVTEKISYSKLMFEYIEKGMAEAAYQVASLNVTTEDWKALVDYCLSKGHLVLAQKCLVRLADWSYLEMIESYKQTMPSSSVNEHGQQQMFLAKFYAYRNLFSEAAKMYKQIKAEHMAVEMFNDLQMYEQAKEYLRTEPHQHRAESSSRQQQVVTSTSANLMAAATGEKEDFTNKWQENQLGDLQTLSRLYISNGEYEKAFQLIVNTNIDNIMNLVSQIDKGETKLLSLIANHFIEKEDFYHAIEVYQKMGDFRNLAQVYIRADQWEEAFKIVHNFPQLKQDVYLPYALWLAENERFIEAQQAFYEAGRTEESYNVLNQLLANAVNENRFHDAAYYCWLLANYFRQLDGIRAEQQQTQQTEISNSDSEQYYTTAQKLYKEADIYYAYYPIYKYIEEPFTSIFVDILFNSALFLFHFIDDDFPKGVSKINVLFSLTKLGKSLGHYKLVRIAYKKLQTMRIPDKFGELIELGSIEIRTKPFTDAEDLASFCYRCSATNSLFGSKQNRCINCKQPFNQSFYSFDILPLIEFEVEKQFTHEQVLSMLSQNVTTSRNVVANEPTTAGNWTEKIEMHSQTLEMDSLGTDTESDRLGHIFNLNEQNYNTNTNLVVLDQSQLVKLNQAQVIYYADRYLTDPVKAHYRYFVNMMPEIAVTVCVHCNKFFYSDEYEFQILKNGHCPFCRN